MSNTEVAAQGQLTTKIEQRARQLLDTIRELLDAIARGCIPNTRVDRLGGQHTYLEVVWGFVGREAAAAFDRCSELLLEFDPDRGAGGTSLNAPWEPSPELPDAARLRKIHQTAAALIVGLNEIKWQVGGQFIVQGLSIAGVRPEQRDHLQKLSEELSRLVGDAGVVPVEGADDYKPASWFTRTTKVKPSRLRQAASPQRKSMRVHRRQDDGTWVYSVADARRWWPDDMQGR